MVQIPEYVAKESLDTDRKGMPQPELVAGNAGLAMVGNALEQFGAHITQRAREKAATAGNWAFEEAAAESKEAAYKLQQEAPVNGQGLHDQIMASNAEIFARHRKDVPADKQEEYDHRTSIYNRGSSVDASQAEYSLSKDYNGAQLEKYAGGYLQNIQNDPSTYDANMAVINKYIEDQPMTRADKEFYRNKFYALGAEAKKQALLKGDPEAGKAAVGFGSIASPNKTLPLLTGTQPGRQKLSLAGTNPQVLSRWMQVQGSLGFQVPIVSAYRSPTINLKAGGVQHSRHLSGSALDLDVRGLSQQQIIGLIRNASAAGFNGIGVYGHGNQVNSVHIDVRNHKSTWGHPPAWAQQAVNDHMTSKSVASFVGGSTFEQGKGDRMMPPAQPVQANTQPSFVQSAASDIMQSENAPLSNQHPDSQVAAYDDGGTPRVGYGSDTYTTADGKVHTVTANTVVSKADADRDVMRRTQESADAAKESVGEANWNKLGNGAKKALTDLDYNYGSLNKPVLAQVRAAAKAGDTEGLAQAIEALPIKGGLRGLRNRRLKNAADVRNDTAVVQPAAEVSAGVPATAMETAPGVTDPAFAQMPYEWRKKALDEIEAAQKQQAQDRQNEAKVLLEQQKQDSLASYEVHGSYDGEEPTLKLFLTADPKKGEIDYNKYKIAKRAALTVHNIATMDVSEARKLRTQYKDAIPKGEYSYVMTQAYNAVDAAVTKNEDQFNKDVADMQHRLHLKQTGTYYDEKTKRLYEPESSIDAAIAVRDQVANLYKQRKSAQIGDLIDEQQKQTLVSGGKAAISTQKDIEAGLKERDILIKQYADKAVSNADTIQGNVALTGKIGVPEHDAPTDVDFKISDPANYPHNWEEYQAKVIAANMEYKMSHMSEPEVQQSMSALERQVTTNADKIMYDTAKKAFKKVHDERLADPFNYAVTHYENVRTAWQDAGNDVNKQAAAANLTFQVQKSWGMSTSTMSVLPAHITDTIATHFKDQDPEVKTEKLQSEVLGLINQFKDPATRAAVMNQLLRSGVPKQVEPAIDAANEGRTEGAVRRLFDAARASTLKIEKPSDADIKLGDAVSDAFTERGGKIYYGATLGNGANQERFDNAVQLLTRRAQLNMNANMDQTAAINAAMDDFFANDKPMDETTAKGPKVQIILKPTDDPVVLERGFDRAARILDKTMTKWFGGMAPIMGNDASAIKLPTEGLVEPGNINLDERIPIRPLPKDVSPEHPADSFMTEYSFSRQDNGQEVLVPSIVNGKLLSSDEAWKHYKDTGEHLGKFSSPAAADAYAEALHNRQAFRYGPNYAATEIKKKELMALKDVYLNRGTFIELQDGYGLFSTDDQSFILRPSDGQPYVFPKDMIEQLGENSKPGTPMRFGTGPVQYDQEVEDRIEQELFSEEPPTESRGQY